VKWFKNIFVSKHKL